MKLSWLHFVYAAWLTTIVGFLISLYYSIAMTMPVCDLCWYQRIAMYPLIIIYLVGILLRDKKCVTYAMPLAVIGLVIAGYQVLLQAGLVPSVLFGCKAGVSCAEVGFKLFGLFSIPVQSFAGFAAIVLFNVLANKSKN